MADLSSMVMLGILAVVLGWFALSARASLAALPPYVGLGGRAWHLLFRGFCTLVLIYLIAPILVVVPLSFNAQPYFTYPIEEYSLRWYRDFFSGERSDVWLLSVRNSVVVATCATLIATTLGTVAAVGLSNNRLPGRTLLMTILISPLVVPLVVTAVGMYFFYSEVNLTPNRLPGWLHLLPMITAHAALGTPFVVITVTATLVGFDHSLTRAAASLGANAVTTFFRITVPLVLPGMISGALFAFITSFDEVVVALFLAGAEEVTIPRQMFSGIREQISPTILAVATMLVALSIALLTTLELLRRRNERLRGIRPS